LFTQRREARLKAVALTTTASELLLAAEATIKYPTVDIVLAMRRSAPELRSTRRILFG
jgi:hypothetical protein